MTMMMKVSNLLSHKRKLSQPLVASEDQPNFLLLLPLRMQQMQTEVVQQLQAKSLSPLSS
jgi:hypothetical protein